MALDRLYLGPFETVVARESEILYITGCTLIDTLYLQMEEIIICKLIC